MAESHVTGFDLKIRRLTAGLRQYEVADRAGLASPRLSEIENGRRAFDASTALRIIHAIESGVGEQFRETCARDHAEGGAD